MLSEFRERPVKPSAAANPSQVPVVSAKVSASHGFTGPPMETTEDIRRESLLATSAALSFCIANADEHLSERLREFIAERMATANAGSIRQLVFKGLLAEIDGRAC